MTTNSSVSPPDISSLSLSPQPQQRPNDPYDYDGSGAGRQHYFQTSPAIHAQSNYNPLSMNQSPLKGKSTRAGLPSQWLESQSSLTESRSLSPPTSSDLSSGGASPPPLGHLSTQHLQLLSSSQILDDEVIPTAIVIKNIPFNVKRETLLDIIESLSIPTPYAFNYHLDPQGAFRGLAFANFRQAADADAVVVALNGFDVQGRKLRVEYKKVLQAGEKERIEREKAIRRMKSMQMEKEQLVVQNPFSHDEFGPIALPTFSPQRSFSGNQSQMAASFIPQQQSPPLMPQLPQTYGLTSPPLPAPPAQPIRTSSTTELDLNDPATLEIYSRILLFKDDHMRDELAFSRTLTAKQRRVVHLVAQKLGVYHYSVGEGEERYAVVTRIDPDRPAQRQPPPSLSRVPSAYIPPSASQASLNALRTKKSMPDMKTLHTQQPRLTTRASNGNIREGYATIASPSRRSPGGFGALFGNNGVAGSGYSIPPVPSLPANLSGTLNGLNDMPASNVVRQPRGPSSNSGFGSRRDRVVASESSARGGLEARSHEPLETLF